MSTTAYPAANNVYDNISGNAGNVYDDITGKAQCRQEHIRRQAMPMTMAESKACNNTSDIGRNVCDNIDNGKSNVRGNIYKDKVNVYDNLPDNVQ